MERRTSYRTAIKHDATVILNSGAKWPCTIADFCNKGMFLTYSMQISNAINAAFSGVARQDFQLSFEGEDGASYLLDVEVARQIDCALGVKFVDDPGHAVEALKELATHQGDHAKEPLSETSKTLVSACTKEALKHSASHFSDVFPLIVDQLKSQAIGASSDQKANSLMELSERFKRKQLSINEAFLNAIADPIQFLREHNAQHQDVSEHLSLVDKVEFEDWLLSRVLITKCEAQYHSELLTLKLRLDSIGLASDDKKASHFGPELFVIAFRKAVDEFIVDSTIERLLFKQFESAFMKGLAPLYETLNQLLIREGVLPDLDVTKVVKKAPAKTAQPKKPNITEPDTSAQDLSDANLSDEIRNTPSGTATQNYAGSPSPLTSGPRVTSDNYADVMPRSPLSDLLESFGEPSRPYGATTLETGNPMPSALGGAISDTSAPFSKEGASASDGADYQRSIAHYNKQAGQAFDRVKGLMQSLHPTTEQAASESHQQAQSDEKYTTEELDKGLTSLQAASLENSEPDTRGLLERVLGNVGDEVGTQKGIDEEQQVAIDVVDRFFDSLKRNPRLSTQALDQLNKLEVPMLKSLLKDENFFSANNSTVRQIMNRLAQLGSRGSRLPPAIQKRVEALVQRVAENYDHEEEVFAAVLDELEALLDQQSAAYSKNAQRVATAAEGLFRAEQSRIAVAQSLNRLIGGRVVPRAVQVLLDSGWRDLLSQLHIKHGADSAEYKEHFKVLVDLLGYSKEPELGLDLKSLLPKIQSGLSQATGSAQAPESVRRELKDYIEKAPKREHVEVDSKPEKVEQTEEQREATNTEILKELKPWIKRARAVELGSWLRLHKKGREIQYMRLVWVAQGYSKFVFVNHQGMKVVELGLFKFARYIRDQVIAVDNEYEVPIVNQSLDDMVKGVYDRLAYESSHDKDSNLLNRNELLRQIRLAMAAGDLAAPCGLVCLRVWEEVAAIKEAISSASAASLGDMISGLVSESSVQGRLSEHDFVVFTIDDDMDLLVLSLKEKLSQFGSDHDSGQFGYQLSEHRSSLGFNNPESMIKHALDDLDPIVPEEDTTDVDSEDKVIKGETASADADLIAKITAQSSSSEEGEFAHSRPFDIYYQRSIGIADGVSDEGQCELLCSEKGSGLSYIPEVAKEAQALDHWWLERLINRYSEANPDWDALGEIRVKLSGYAFMDDEFVERLCDLASQGFVQPEEIWFDIYDSASITDVHAASDRIGELSSLGFRFCLDQFGSSRAPFYLMKSLPVQMIKIDQSYIEDLNKDEEQEGPTGSIVEVAHYLDRKVLASSVDTAICLQKMRALGLDYAQGDTIAEYELLEE